MLYLCDLFFIFILTFIMDNRMNTDKLVLSLIFQNVLLFLDDNVDKNVNNFQIAIVQPQGVAYRLLNVLPISVWRCL